VLFHFLDKFKTEIERQHAQYFHELYQSYSAYSLFLNHKDKEANVLATEIHRRVKTGGLKRNYFGH